MFVAIAKPQCSTWCEPIVGKTMASVLNEILYFYVEPDTIIIDGNDLTLKWDDPEVNDEEWFIGKYEIK